MIVVQKPKLVPHGAAAIAVWPFVIVRDPNPSKKLLEHERVHLKQQLRWCLIGFALLYWLSPKMRYRWELEAYKVSMDLGMSAFTAASHLSGPLYKNMVTFDQAWKDLHT